MPRTTMCLSAMDTDEMLRCAKQIGNTAAATAFWEVFLPEHEGEEVVEPPCDTFWEDFIPECVTAKF